MQPSPSQQRLQPLTGIRIVDLTRLLPGPWSTMLLGDLGADVVKVENPVTGGDPSRAAQPRYRGDGDEESVYFWNVNRNKRSIALDLKDRADREALLAIVRDADVVVENFRPGAADRLGIGYAALRGHNPRLVYCALSGYGQDGPLSQLAGHDLNIAGMSGLLQPDASRAPAMPTMLMGDYAGAAMAVIGILAALVERGRHGRGSLVDVSMLDALMSWTSVHVTNAFARSVDPAQQGRVEGWGGNPRYGMYRTRDGRYVTVSLLEKHYWDAFCRLQGREDLINPDETESDRLTSHGERGERYRAFLETLFATRDRDAWVAELQAAGLPVCPVLTPEEAVASAYGRLRGHYRVDDSARLGRQVPQMGFPFRLTTSDGADGFALRREPPALGDANADLLFPPSSGLQHVDVR